jgi:hypothetical protein
MDIPHIPGFKNLAVGTTEEEFLIRVEGTTLVVQEKWDSTKQCRWVETHPSRMEETEWKSVVSRLVRDQLQTSVLEPVQLTTDQSSLYQQIRQLAATVPILSVDEIWKYRGCSSVPGASERLTDTNPPVVSLLRLVTSNDLHSLLYAVVYFTQVDLSRIYTPRSINRVQPVATAYNLLEAVCFYNGFLLPTLYSATIVIDDLRLPGLDGNALFKQQKDNPGEFRVWYTADTSSTVFPCRICRVQEYTKASKDSNRLVDVDHTSPVVLDRVFRRYAVLLTHVLHTQAHQANVHAVQLAHAYLAIDDPLRKLIDVCTNSSPLVEGIVAQKLFFDFVPKKTAALFSPLKWLSTDQAAKVLTSVSGARIFSALQGLYIKPLGMSYNSIQHLKRLPSTTLLFQFSPVLNAIWQFNDIIHAACRRLQTISPAFGGRQDTVQSYNTSEVPCVRSMGAVRDGFDILENVIMMVLQHHCTHTFHSYNPSQTSVLLWHAADIDRAHVFDTSATRTQHTMQFGKNFPAALNASPVLQHEIVQMGVKLRRLESNSERLGIPIFRDLASSIQN